MIFVHSEIQLKMKKFYLGSTSNGSIGDSLDDLSLDLCQLENVGHVFMGSCRSVRLQEFQIKKIIISKFKANSTQRSIDMGS